MHITYDILINQDAACMVSRVHDDNNCNPHHAGEPNRLEKIEEKHAEKKEKIWHAVCVR